MEDLPLSFFLCKSALQINIFKKMISPVDDEWFEQLGELEDAGEFSSSWRREIKFRH